jgi:hypothetical protein
MGPLVVRNLVEINSTQQYQYFYRARKGDIVDHRSCLCQNTNREFQNEARTSTESLIVRSGSTRGVARIDSGIFEK